MEFNINLCVIFIWKIQTNNYHHVEQSMSQFVGVVSIMKNKNIKFIKKMYGHKVWFNIFKYNKICCSFHTKPNVEI